MSRISGPIHYIMNVGSRNGHETKKFNLVQIEEFSSFEKRVNPSFIRRVLSYVRNCKNWPSVIWHLLLDDFPFVIVLKNNRVYSVTRPGEASYAKYLTRYDATIDNNNILRLNVENQEIKLVGYGQSCVSEVFFEEDYAKLNVFGKDVIDVGANIADSAIYFTLKGAKRVIAIEPILSTYQVAQRNLNINNMSNVILINAGIGKISKEIEIDPSIESNGGNVISELRGGYKIPLYSIEYLLDHFSVFDAILKMDCEGCEYESILNTGNIYLRRFSAIMIECHYGNTKIIEKLSHTGFEVYSSREIKSPWLNKGKHMLVSMVFAKRIN